MPVFNEEEFLLKWDEDFPPIVIIDEIKDEKDNDWVLAEEEEEQLIAAYFSNKEQN